MKKLLILDTFNFLHRAYHALPKTFMDINGEPTNAVYGVTSMLINVLDQIKPDYVIAAMDTEDPTFRVENFTGYKAHRKPLDMDLYSQIPKVVEILKAFGVKMIEIKGYEADDIIGTLVERFSTDVEIIIVSNDRDLWQLISKNVLVMCPSKGNTTEWIGENEVEVRLGIKPSQVTDYKALRGDTSDNIPGVHGIGEKTAVTLIKQYGDIEGVYRNIATITPASLQGKLAANAEEAVLSKQLATIIRDAPFTIKLTECKYMEFNKAKVKDVLQRYNFKSLIKRLGFENSKELEVSDDQLTFL